MGTLELTNLKKELKFAEEGLAQMVSPDAGYDMTTQQGRTMFENDVNSQCSQIGKLYKKIESLES